MASLYARTSGAVNATGGAPRYRERGFGLLIFFAVIKLAIFTTIGVLLSLRDEGKDPAERSQI